MCDERLMRAPRRRMWSRSALTDCERCFFARPHTTMYPSGSGGDGDIDPPNKNKNAHEIAIVARVTRSRPTTAHVPSIHLSSFSDFLAFSIPFYVFLPPTRHIGTTSPSPLGHHASTAPLCHVVDEDEEVKTRVFTPPPADNDGVRHVV